MTSTGPLLSDNGRLSAKAIAGVFGVPWARIAQWIGKSKQAVGKIPDSPSIQSSLRPFERIARLRVRGR